MLYVDDIAALWQWRVWHASPAVARHISQLHGKPLANTPTAGKEFSQELQYLPATPIPWHFMVADDHMRFQKKTYGYTLCTGPVPQDAFYCLSAHACIATPELVFVELARKLPFEQVIKLGNELCGTYACLHDADGAALNREQPLTSVRRLRAFAERASWMRGTRKALRALRYVLEGAASPREAELAMLAALPTHLGGRGYPQPQMGLRVDFNKHAATIAGRRFARCDLGWREAKLDVEYDGRDYHYRTEAQMLNDKARANALACMGYDVVTVSRYDFASAHRLEALMDEISRKLGHRVHRKLPDARERRERLHASLLTAERVPLFRSRSIGDFSQTVWDCVQAARDCENA